MVKYHISKETNRPNICKANIQSCPLGKDEPHFTSKEEAKYYIEQENEKNLDMFSTNSKIAPKNDDIVIDVDKNVPIKEKLLQADFYIQYSAANPGYFQPDEETARLAVEVMKSIEPTEFSQQDFSGKAEKKVPKVSSVVRRIPLPNGDGAYFKSLPTNYQKLTSVDSYTTTNLKMMLNEVRAYNVAKALDYQDLVPETIVAPVGKDDFGSLQKEVKGSWGRINKYDDAQADLNKRAAIFDFVIGSQDRHDNNYLFYDKEDGSRGVHLIDNGYAFPEDELFYFNASDFACAEEYDLDETDYENLRNLEKELNHGELGKQFNERELRTMKDRIRHLKTNGSTAHPIDYFDSIEPDFNEDHYWEGDYFR